MGKLSRSSPHASLYAAAARIPCPRPPGGIRTRTGPEARLLACLLQGAKSRQKQVELRTLVAHVFRCTADGLRPGSLRTEPLLRSRVLDFLRDSLKFLASATSGERLGF